MKFACGLRAVERLRRESQWHRWFAWFPVTVGDYDCRWLEHVECRRGEFGFWEFRAEGSRND